MNETTRTHEFEALLAELQETVKRLETEELTLQESVDAYERSVEIANACASMLDEAELRVQQIDASSREIREQASIYAVDPVVAARLLLGDDDDDLADLLSSDE